MSKALVSILIPVYNREKLVQKAIESAINQTYKNIEIVVIDNKSTDNTFEILKEIAKSHPNVKVYQNEENIGPVRNWRRCLDYATGEYVKILWSDDLIAPSFIEKTLPYLVDCDDVSFVFSGTEIFNDDTGQRTKAYFIGDTGIYDSKKFIEDLLLGDPLPSPGCVLFRKIDLEKNILIDIPNKFGLDFNLTGAGNDMLMLLLTAKDYPKFAFVNETLSFFRKHGDSITFSSNKLELTTLGNIAKAYFVENYIKNRKLKKKFNARLLIFLLKHKRKNNITIKTIKDFYFVENNIQVDYVFFASLILKNILAELPSHKQNK